MTAANTAFGIDIGGSGIKGAIVDIDSGELASDRVRIPTPKPATPDAVLDVVAEVVQQSGWDGPFGCTFPAIVHNGVIHSASNVDDSWIGVDAQHRLHKKLGHAVRVLNDADAAGIAEMRFGAGRAYRDNGVVLMLTFGTGIGSAIFTQGVLLPNTELGELEMNGQRAETQAAGRLREEKVLSWKAWTDRVQNYLSVVEGLFSPDLIIFGGGISSKSDKFLPQLKTQTQVVPAELRNNAGIVGAGLAGSTSR